MTAPQPLSQRRARHGVRVLLASVLAVLLAALAVPARAEGNASLVDLEVTLQADGSLRVEHTLTPEGEVPAEVTQRVALRQNVLGDRQYVYRLSDVTVAGAPAQVEESGDAVTITVPTAGTEPISWGYTVTGATFAATATDETLVRWRVLQGLSVSVGEVTGRASIPGLARDFQCLSGPPVAENPGVCRFSASGTEEYPQPEFADGPLGQGEMVLLQFAMPTQAVAVTEQVEHRWTLGRAFSVDPLPLALALGTLLVGGALLWLLHRKAGRDAVGGHPVRVAEFRPVAAGQSEFSLLVPMRPGQVGTLLDERVDPIDVTASLIDLAVRGHLRIEELPRADEFSRTDWKLVHLPGGEGSELAAYEKALLSALTPPEGRDAILVSEIGPAIAAHIDEVQSCLYDDVVQQGWYDHRPDDTRSTWGRAAAVSLVVAVVATVALVAMTPFGLLGLALLAITLGFCFVSQEMPSRTSAGSGLLAGLDDLRRQLATQPTDQMPAGHELHELSEVLPYAIVLGGRDRWIDAIVRADDDPTEPDSTDLAWYHGPPNWYLRHLPESLKNFVSTVSGNLFAR